MSVQHEVNVFQVTATPPDINSQVRYSVGGSMVNDDAGNPRFSVDDNGQVYVTRSPIDRDPPEGSPRWQVR